MVYPDWATPANHSQLINILADLNEIGATITRLDMGSDLQATLQLIAESAVQAAAISPKSTSGNPAASAVIWVYDAADDSFDPALRVSAGEPKNISIVDQPRQNGLGRKAIERKTRILSYEEAGYAIHPAKQAGGANVMVCYPLLVNNEVVGLLYIYRCDGQPFDTLSLMILGNLVNLTAMAIHFGQRINRITRQLEQKISDLESLRWAAQRMRSRATLHEMLWEILDIGLDMTAAQYGTFELYDPYEDALVVKALAGRRESGDQPTLLTVSENSIVGQVGLKKRSILISDLRDPQWRSIYQTLPVDREMRSELAVPLLGPGERLEGVLNIESPRPDAFSVADQRLLELLAGRAVIALQELRLLDAMQDIAEALLRADVEQLLKLIIDRACSLTNLTVGSIWTISGQELVLRQATEGYHWKKRLPLSDSVTEQAIRRRGPVTVEDVKTHPNFKNRELALDQGWVCGIVVPLLSSDKGADALGGFSLYSSFPRDFTDWDKKLLTCLANHATITIQNAEGVAALRQSYNLSARENEVLILLIEGQTNKQIAESLTVSVNTVKKHVQGIFTKLEVESRAAAVAKVLARS